MPQTGVSAAHTSSLHSAQLQYEVMLCTWHLTSTGSQLHSWLPHHGCHGWLPSPCSKQQQSWRGPYAFLSLNHLLYLEEVFLERKKTKNQKETQLTTELFFPLYLPKS